MIDELGSRPRVKDQFSPPKEPLIKGDDPVPYWARQQNDTLYVFFAHPGTRELDLPLEYGERASLDRVVKTYEVNFSGISYQENLRFSPPSSILMKFENGRSRKLDVSYSPPESQLKKRKKNAPRPWKVKGARGR